MRAIGAKRKQVMRSVDARSVVHRRVRLGGRRGCRHRRRPQGIAIGAQAFGLELPAADTVVNSGHDHRLDGHRHRRDRDGGVPAGPQGREGRSRSRRCVTWPSTRTGDVEDAGRASAPSSTLGRRGASWPSGLSAAASRSGRSRCARRVRRRRGARPGHRPAVRPIVGSPLPTASGHGRHAGPGERDRETRVARRRRRRR